MPDTQRIDIPGVGIVEFPASMSDADISAAAKRLHDEATPHASEVKPSSTHAVMLAAGKAVAPAANLAAEVATNPNVPRMAANAGRVIGAVAPIATGAAAGGPMGAAVGVAGAAKGSWLGGKTGYFTGKLAQQAAAPVANILEKAAPVANAVARIAGPQGLLDLAQVAEPNRKDIGFLGMGATPDNLTVLKAAVKKGANPTQAAAQLAKGDPKLFAALLTAYSQSVRAQ